LQAQGFMACIKGGKDGPQAVLIERAIEIKAHDFSDGARCCETLDEPQSFLSE